jgi:hypothetical protein
MAGHLVPNPNARKKSQTRTMHAQCTFRLKAERLPGEPCWQHQSRQQTLNATPKAPTTRQRDSFAALLKSQAQEVMRAVTECQPAAVPANVARLTDLVAVIRAALSGGLVSADEGALTDGNLLHLYTLADHLAALEITRRDLRAPAFVSRQTSDHAAVMATLAEIQNQNNALAAMVAMRNGGVQ